MEMKACRSFRLRSVSLENVRLRRIFDSLDENKDGQISLEELLQAVQRLGLPIEREGLHATVGSFFESARNGGLEFEDFVDLHRFLGQKTLGNEAEWGEGKEERERENEQDLKEAFRVFDKDGDGFISAAELQWVLRKLGHAQGNDINNCERMICAVDRNHDGQVDFLEFKNMMQNFVAV